MSIKNEAIKTMLELSNSISEADGIIMKFTDHREYEKKRDFVLRLFPEISIIGGCDGKKGNKAQTDYEAVLSAVINLKWR